MENLILEKLWVIYKNTKIMLTDRNYKLVDEKKKYSEYYKKFYNVFITINFIKPNGEKGVVYISKFIRSFKKEIFNKAVKSFDKDIVHIIMIVDYVTRIDLSKYILKNKHVEIIHIKKFYFALTRHKFSMPHKLLTEKEKKELFENASFNFEQLMKIYISDPFTIHYGAKIGDIFEINRRNKYGNLSTFEYRKVVAVQ
jgi:DNA-directed RNA polymerase subunit H (RpoH/RPB5)